MLFPGSRPHLAMMRYPRRSAFKRVQLESGKLQESPQNILKERTCGIADVRVVVEHRPAKCILRTFARFFAGHELLNLPASVLYS